jgi:hypothetical protein
MMKSDSKIDHVRFPEGGPAEYAEAVWRFLLEKTPSD